MFKTKNVVFENSDNEENSLPVLVKLCSREKALLQAMPFVQDGSYYFWTINISPDTPVKCRDKTKAFKDCKVKEQYYYFNRRIMQFAEHCPYLCNSIIIVEHHQSGNIHFHGITRKGEFIQDMKADLIRLFGINTKKYENLNIKIREVDNVFKTIAYLFKQPLDYVSEKNEDTIDDFNTSIINKQYEVSKFIVYVLEEKIKLPDYEEHFND